MITQLNIKNFKSIVDLTVQLSNVNVFIGENGCGKSNILEAIGFAGEAFSGELKPSNLYLRGIRNAKPSLIFSSFADTDDADHVTVNFSLEGKNYEFLISVDDKNAPFPTWKLKLSGLDVLLHLKSGPLLSNENVEMFVPLDLIDSGLKDFLIYTPQTPALRGLTNESRVEPLGINGENIDVLISALDSDELAELKENAGFIEWLDEFSFDANNELKREGYKAGRGTSRLYFKDKYMKQDNNIFSAENANEGVLHVLFYLTLMISRRTPAFFAIDNIENGLNPKLCRSLMKKITELAVKKNKQVLITTHNPATLDGLNLNDERQRLFVVKRNDEGHTKTERIRVKPSINGESLKLSEMWMRGYLGGLPSNF